MMTAGITIVASVAGIALTFSVLSLLRGPRFAFLAVCWVPLAGLLWTIVRQDQLGYAVLAVLAAVVVASVALVGLGVSVCVNARRDKAGIGFAAFGTLVAGLPLLGLLVIWLTNR